jgi:ferritin
MFFDELVEKLKLDLKNERKHMLFYLTHASSVVGSQRLELRELLLKEAASEMKHVQEFQDFIIGIGGKLTDKDLDYFDFPLLTDAQLIVAYAYNMEMEVVRNYHNRLKEAEALNDYALFKWLEIFLEKQIENSRLDADNLKQILINFK